MSPSKHAEVPKKRHQEAVNTGLKTQLSGDLSIKFFFQLKSESGSIIGQLFIIVWIKMSLAVTDNVCQKKKRKEKKKTNTQPERTDQQVGGAC